MASSSAALGSSRLLRLLPLSCHLRSAAASASAVGSLSVGLTGNRSISTQSLAPSDTFERRHNSATLQDVNDMVAVCGFKSLDALVEATVPDAIKRTDGMPLDNMHEPLTESQFLSKFKAMASQNTVNRSFIGMGYYDTHVPPVILRNVLENPGWYTQYTPYQAEISQGRLESLLNYQTMITDLTGLPMANASLLDEGTAAAEAMTMCSALARGKKTKFLIDDRCHPQTIGVCVSRADGLGLEAIVAPYSEFSKHYANNDVCGVLVQYPDTDGNVNDYQAMTKEAHDAKVLVVAATDLLALTSLKPPGEWGADIAVGSAQRFGVPMGYGGPHAAFLATSDEYKRLMPGRIIGVSIDSGNKPALRMAMQTREQHIRRDKATSNICTAQALLANMAAMYAVYHGPEGLKTIANRVHGLASIFASGATSMGATVTNKSFFDTVTVNVGAGKAAAVHAAAYAAGMNLRPVDDATVGVAFDETTSVADVDALFAALSKGMGASAASASAIAPSVADENANVPPSLVRTSKYLTHPIFNSYGSEHEMLRYLARLEAKDLSLKHSMIALGSCTMKLNATSEMIPVTWPEWCNLHPFVPQEQAKGYYEMFDELSKALASITGFDSVSLQPNSGASGEYAGLMAIRAFHQANGDHNRDVCIIPVSAHGTNPASAVMAGMKVVSVGVDAAGNVDRADFEKKVAENKDRIAALMVTYPSTFGVYEEGVNELCDIIHEAGGQVYMDGANMNAQVGLTSPGQIGADVCHLNLHKTFCIPHGGGGPGMGPIGVNAHLAPFLPSHPVVTESGAMPVGSDGGRKEPFGTMAAAPYGSALILTISHAYINMMGSKGLTEASKRAILNANYMANRLDGHYKILFTGKNGTCAHEFIMDLRPFKDSHGIEAEDIAKRLIDYGYHAPTMSWPVAGTLMVEPTESESKEELDRFCDAMIAIRKEIAEVESGAVDKENNVLKGAPHPAYQAISGEWDKPYSREKAVFPAPWVRQSKFWPTTGRVDNVFGDRNLNTVRNASGVIEGDELFEASG